MKRFPVSRIIPFSGVDGPGNRAVVFVQGCNQDCLYCHNPETLCLCSQCGTCIPHCPTGALHMENGKVSFNATLCCRCDQCIQHCESCSDPRIRTMTAEDIFREIAPSLPYIRGITVSGGECTLYPDFLIDLAVLAHVRNKTLFLDTNGQIPLWKHPELAEVIDSAMIDLKASNAAEFLTVTRRTNEAVPDNITFMAKLGKLYEIRTVLCPDIMDIQKTVALGASLIAPYPSVRYKLIRFRSNGVRRDYAGLTPPSDEEVAGAADIARACGVRNILIV